MTRRDVRLGTIGIVLATGLVAWTCTGPGEPPTTPEPLPSSAPPPTAAPAVSPLPPPVIGAPAPKASPTPDPSPDPGGPREGATECGSPIPPALRSLKVKVHLRVGDARVLDSTPLVGPDPAYCAAIGYTDGRSTCPVRPEGHPQREACELYATGRAVDTGRPGPTWRLEGRLCRSRASGCENHPDNQYLLLAFGRGTYQACARDGTCGEVDVDD
jgi:hypothetical protein